MDIRPSPISGRWYPGDPKRLADSVDSYISAARIGTVEGDVVGIIVPHAGHIYSGPVAGYAFKAVRGKDPELVVVISPMHQPYLQPFLTCGHEAYQTPLGTIKIDSESVAALSDALDESLGYKLTPVRNDQEHSLEIELPFLQRSLGGEFKLLPIMIREVSAQAVETLGRTIANIISGRSALLVASSDLSHFYDQLQAEQLDAEMLRQVESFNPAGVLQAEQEGKGFACGRNAIAAVLWAAQEMGANKVAVLNHATSGDVTGDYSGVVGYAAAIITR